MDKDLGLASKKRNPATAPNQKKALRARTSPGTSPREGEVRRSERHREKGTQRLAQRLQYEMFLGPSGAEGQAS